MSKAIARALQHHGAGRLQEAEALYRQVLAEDPGNIDALHFLGVIAYQRGDAGEAVQLISEALALKSANAPAHNNLGLALAAQGKAVQAVAAFLDALALQPDYADAFCNLAHALKARGRVQRALGCYRRALSLMPESAPPYAAVKRTVEELAQQAPRPAPETALTREDDEADEHVRRANTFREQGRVDEAIAAYRRALLLAPDLTEAHVNLGSALAQQGEIAQAIASTRRAIALDPTLAAAQFNLGVFSHRRGDLAAARAALRQYLQAEPDDATALAVLGETCVGLNELDDAAACMERILARDPAAAAAHNLLANIRRNQGRHGEALEHYEQAIRHGGGVLPFQNLLFCMMCTADSSPAAVHARHVDFAQRFEQPLLAMRSSFRNTTRDPCRRLRIGYVSPDLRDHITGRYVEAILQNHDRRQFEVHCYFAGAVGDAFSERLASLVEGWHNVHALSDDAFAALVREHQVDILVDLCGHGPGNRILALARKPAPVQVSYLDYSATTGLSSMDHRLTTEYCDPPGIADPYYTEKLFRLRGTYWTYNPPLRLPIGALPLRANGYATFGSFNLYYRITGEVVRLWSRLLQAIPRSRLLIVSVASGSTQAALRETMSRAGIAPERLSIFGVVSYAKYHELMAEADIALAPYPYNGATTAMDCLWNGLPVISKAGGATFYSRLGCAVLESAGLSELIAVDEQDYIGIATRLAGDPARLSDLRRTLRDRMERSPMRDFAGFTRSLEAAYREMWKAWCLSDPG